MMIKGTLVMLAQSCPSMIASASLLKALLKIFFFFENKHSFKKVNKK